MEKALKTGWISPGIFCSILCFRELLQAWPVYHLVCCHASDYSCLLATIPSIHDRHVGSGPHAWKYYFNRNRLREERDISEEVALGLPNARRNADTLFDQRLFNKTRVSWWQVSYTLEWWRFIVHRASTRTCSVAHWGLISDEKVNRIACSCPGITRDVVSLGYG